MNSENNMTQSQMNENKNKRLYNTTPPVKFEEEPVSPKTMLFARTIINSIESIDFDSKVLKRKLSDSSM